VGGEQGVALDAGGVADAVEAGPLGLDVLGKAVDDDRRALEALLVDELGPGVDAGALPLLDVEQVAVLGHGEDLRVVAGDLVLELEPHVDLPAPGVPDDGVETAAHPLAHDPLRSRAGRRP